MPDLEKIIKELESLRDICNARSNMAIGKGKIAWAGYANAADDAIELLKEQPEIVRCKDCKHKVDTVDDYEDESECPCYCSSDPYYSWVPDDDWFCAGGERRQ